MNENEKLNKMELDTELEDIELEDTEDAETEDGNTKVMTPMKTIRAKCLDCCGGQYSEVKMCPCTNCPLYDFRLGKNPNRKPRNLTEEQREALRERARKAQAARKKK